jgi:hypothetical protein
MNPCTAESLALWVSPPRLDYKAAGAYWASGGKVKTCPAPETIYLFALACAGLALLPGPALIFVVTRGAVHGRRDHGDTTKS